MRRATRILWLLAWFTAPPALAQWYPPGWGGAGALTTSYVQMALMSATPGAPSYPWTTGEPVIVRDNGGAHDLVGLAITGTSFSAFTSQDNGTTWAWVTGLTAALTKAPEAAVQDSTGKVHCMVADGVSGTILYSRLAFTRTSGHVTNVTADVTEVQMTSVTINTNNDVHVVEFVGTDQGGSNTLFYAAYDDPATTTRGRVQAGKTTTAAALAPTLATDFNNLSNTSGATSIFTSTNANCNSHENTVHMAQHPSSGDLWFEWGPADTLDTSLSNNCPLDRLRATENGLHTWALGTATQVDVIGASVAPQELSMTTSPNFVWFLHLSPSSGILIDKANSSGTITSGAITSPDSTTGNEGSFGIEINQTSETEAWVAGWIAPDSTSATPAFKAYHWTGSAWTTFNDSASWATFTYDAANNYGIGKSAGWGSGLAMSFWVSSSTVAKLYVGTIRTQ